MNDTDDNKPFLKQRKLFLFWTKSRTKRKSQQPTALMVITNKKLLFIIIIPLTLTRTLTITLTITVLVMTKVYLQ